MVAQTKIRKSGGRVKTRRVLESADNQEGPINGELNRCGGLKEDDIHRLIGCDTKRSCGFVEGSGHWEATDSQAKCGIHFLLTAYLDVEHSAAAPGQWLPAHCLASLMTIMD